MRFDDDLYEGFLKEMQELEEFRLSYATAHPEASLDRDDPDVKRLMEGLAYFSARTHRAAVRNIAATQRRIFQQFFPYLMAPLPAMGILKARPTGQFVESALLPKGTEFAVSSGREITSIFQTVQDVRILPVNLIAVTMAALSREKGVRFALCLKGMHAVSDEVDKISFHITHLNNYLASLRVFNAIKKHLKSVSIVYDEKVTEKSRGEACQISFGPLTEGEEREHEMHPVQQERLFFHFPRQDLFMTVRAPARMRSWTEFAICLDMDSGWPKNLILGLDVFHPFSVPVINLRRSLSEPIFCEGFKERYPIRYPDPEKRFVFHSVRGVFRVETTGMVPIRSGILAGGGGSYELEQEVDAKGKKQHYLCLNFPDAVEKPGVVSIDALWFQPGFSSVFKEKLKIYPYTINLTGMMWDLSGSIQAHADAGSEENMDDFLHLLTLQNKPELNMDDLNSLLRIMGSPFQGVFQPMKKVLKGVTVKKAPLPKRELAGMFKLVYRLQFSEFDPDLMPLTEMFTHHVGRLLNAWISEAVVEISMEFPRKNKS